MLVTGRMESVATDDLWWCGTEGAAILNIVGLVKLILGKKVWMAWELDLGKPEDPQQRYFTEEQGRKSGHSRCLCAEFNPVAEASQCSDHSRSA